MDPYIEEVAANNRAAALTNLSWHLDHLRLMVGLVEVVQIEQGIPPRRLRRTPSVVCPEPVVRFLPLFNGTGVFVRDVM